MTEVKRLEGEVRGSETPAKGIFVTLVNPQNRDTQPQRMEPTQSAVPEAPVVHTPRVRSPITREAGSPRVETRTMVRFQCQLVAANTIRADITFEEDLTSRFDIPGVIAVALGKCKSAKLLAPKNSSSKGLILGELFLEIRYAISAFDYTKYILPLHKQVKTLAAQKKDGVCIRLETPIPQALLNWSVPLAVSDNISKEEGVICSISQSTPNLYHLSERQREAITFCLHRNGRCMFADPLEMDVAAEALLAAYQYRDKFPLFIVTQSGSIPYWREQVYMWYNRESVRDACLSEWLVERNRFMARLESVAKGALVRKPKTDAPKLVARTKRKKRFRYVYEPPERYAANFAKDAVVYALQYDDIEGTGVFAQAYAQAVQMGFEDTFIARDKFVIVLSMNHFLTLCEKGMVQPQLSTVICTNVHDYKATPLRRIENVFILRSVFPRIILCTTAANVGLMRNTYLYLAILGLNITRQEFLLRYCDLKKRELSTGKVVNVAVGMKMLAEMDYIFSAICLSRSADRYIAPVKRVVMEVNGHGADELESAELGHPDTIADIANMLFQFHTLNQEPFVIVMRNKDIGKSIYDSLVTQHMRISLADGKDKLEAVVDSVHVFQNGETDVLMFFQDALSAISSATRAHVCFFENMSWSASEVSEVEGRLRRVGCDQMPFYSIFLTCSSSGGSRDASYGSTRFSAVRHETTAKDGFVHALQQLGKVLPWRSYPRVSTATLTTTQLNALDLI